MQRYFCCWIEFQKQKQKLTFLFVCLFFSNTKREIIKEVVKKIPLLTLPDGFGVDPAKILPYVLELAMEERKRTRSNEKGDCFPGSSVLLLISADAKGRKDHFTEASIRLIFNICIVVRNFSSSFIVLFLHGRVVGKGIKTLSSDLIVSFAYLSEKDDGEVLRRNLVDPINLLLGSSEKILGKDPIFLLPADMRLHEELCEHGGLHDKEDMFCFRCPIKNTDKKVIFEVVTMAKDATLMEIAEENSVFFGDLVF